MRRRVRRTPGCCRLTMNTPSHTAIVVRWWRRRRNPIRELTAACDRDRGSGGGDVDLRAGPRRRRVDAVRQAQRAADAGARSRGRSVSGVRDAEVTAEKKKGLSAVRLTGPANLPARLGPAPTAVAAATMIAARRRSSTRAFRLRARFVDGQAAAAQLKVVQLGDRLGRLVIGASSRRKRSRARGRSPCRASPSTVSTVPARANKS